MYGRGSNLKELQNKTQPLPKNLIHHSELRKKEPLVYGLQAVAQKVQNNFKFSCKEIPALGSSQNQPLHTVKTSCNETPVPTS